jgi:hypothetical protein
MEMMDLPELAGCMRMSFVERPVRTNLPYSMAMIDSGQFVILRLKEEYWEED